MTEIELDCGHWIMDELPDETNQAILTWLDRQETEPPTRSVGAPAQTGRL